MVFSRLELPIAPFNLLGLNPGDPADVPAADLSLLLQGRRTSPLSCRPTLPGEPPLSPFKARLHLSRHLDGGVTLRFHPRHYVPENRFTLSPEQMDTLATHPDNPILTLADDQLYSVYLDPQTHELLGLPVDTLRAPLAVNGQFLTEEQAMRFTLGETITLSHPAGPATVLRLDPFARTGLTGRNLHSVDITVDGSVITLPFSGPTLIDQDYLLAEDLGGLVLIEQSLKAHNEPSDHFLRVEVDKAFQEANTAIIELKARQAGHVSPEDIARLLARHLALAGITALPDLDSSFTPISNSPAYVDSGEPAGVDNEDTYALVGSNRIDGMSQLMFETAIGATVIGRLSISEKEKLASAIDKAQVALNAGIKTVNAAQLQASLLDILKEQLGERLAIYHKNGQQPLIPTVPAPKQQPNITT